MYEVPCEPWDMLFDERVQIGIDHDREEAEWVLVSLLHHLGGFIYILCLHKCYVHIRMRGRGIAVGDYAEF